MSQSPFDLHAIQEAMERQQAKAAELDERLKAVEGRAESDDSLVAAVVVVTELRSLRLDPKAMRLPSVDLAETIVQVVADAQADYARQRDELVAELGAGPAPTDVGAMLADMREIGDIVARGQSDVQALFDDFRRRTTG